MTYKRFAIVKVPFPFTDPYATKTRSALIISAAEPFNGFCRKHKLIVGLLSHLWGKF